MRNRWLFFFLALFFFFLLNGTEVSSVLEEKENPMEQREEKLKTFRAKRDQFFREDSHSPLKESDRKKFKGLNYYPIDLRYAITGSIRNYPIAPKPIYVYLPTNKGKERKYVKYGGFRFKWEGKEYILQIYRPLGGGELFLPFRDQTCGSETCPEGRYLHIEPMPDGKVLIDFNRAYNPSCEYNEKYACPFAPEENKLTIPIRAGEKRYR